VEASSGPIAVRKDSGVPHPGLAVFARQGGDFDVAFAGCPTHRRLCDEWALRWTSGFGRGLSLRRRPHIRKRRECVGHPAYLSTVTVAPVTSTIRGVPSEVVLNEEYGMKSPCAVNLHNAVTVSQQRLGRRVAQLSAARMNEVCAALRFSLGCDSN
jgi:mRNA interferase MazF